MNTGTRWLVSEESVETVEGIRRTFLEAADEGFPTPEEIMELTRRTRSAAREKRDVA